MRERREIPARADTPLLRNWRIHIRIEHLENQIDELRASARVTLGNYIGAQEHHRARFALWQSVTNTRGMAAHEIYLQGGQFLGRYRDFGKFPESGCDAVYD